MNEKLAQLVKLLVETGAMTEEDMENTGLYGIDYKIEIGGEIALIFDANTGHFIRVGY